jgi:hypothetical protein
VHFFYSSFGGKQFEIGMDLALAYQKSSSAIDKKTQNYCQQFYKNN